MPVMTPRGFESDGANNFVTPEVGAVGEPADGVGAEGDHDGADGADNQRAQTVIIDVVQEFG